MRSLLMLAMFVALPALAAPPDGWLFKAGEKGKPAVLLIHGLAASRGHWKSPSETWSIKNAHFKHWKEPKPQSGTSKLPKVPGDVRSIVVSSENKRADEDGSFWKYLTSQGFTVATFNQVPCMDSSKTPSDKCLSSDTFDAAYPSAKAALEHLASLTTEDIALVGHSRGGLLARRLLKESPEALPAVSRVKWYVSLHTPHHGSSMATKGAELQRALKNPLRAIDLDFVPKVLRDAAKKLMPAVGDKLSGAIDALVTMTGLSGARELAKGGPLYQALERGEQRRPGVKYFTFGGTSPRVARVFARVYSDGGFEWKTKPKELLDFPKDLKVPFAEMKRGGDLLVTDESAHFAFEDRHFTNGLNHAEVLWNRKVQEKVAALLVAQPAPVDDGEAGAGDGDTDDEPDDDPAKDE